MRKSQGIKVMREFPWLRWQLFRGAADPPLIDFTSSVITTEEWNIMWKNQQGHCLENICLGIDKSGFFQTVSISHMFIQKSVMSLH